MFASDYQLLSLDPTGVFPVAKHTVTCIPNLATTADSEELAGMLYALDVVQKGREGRSRVTVNWLVSFTFISC